MFKQLSMALSLIFLLYATSLQAQGSKELPNIIYIMVDDMGYGDLSCYGQATLKTPHIDQIAKEGMRFTDHYSGHTVCRPSRLVLLTGRHSGNTPIHGNAPYTLPANAETVTTLLKDAGYTTGGVGKWALGLPKTEGVPSKPVSYTHLTLPTICSV